MNLFNFFRRFMASLTLFAVEDGAGGAVDRGDDFQPTEGDEDEVKPAPKVKTAPAPKVDPVQGEADGLRELDGDPEPGAEDGEGDTVDEAKTDPKRKDDRIPASRHKAILDAERAKRDAVENELKKYREGQQLAVTNEQITAAEDRLMAAEAEYSKLVVDGDIDKATTKMREIRALERDITGQRMTMQIAAAEARAVEQVRYSTTVERMEEAYPQLNPDHENFDREKTGEVLEMKEAFQARGYTPTQALQKAIKYVMPPVNREQAQAVEVTPRVDAADATKAKAEARAAEQRKKNAEAAGKQPPSTTKVGVDHDKMGGTLSAKDVLKMSQDDFMKLDDKTLAAMRGDEIEA